MANECNKKWEDIFGDHFWGIKDYECKDNFPNVGEKGYFYKDMAENLYVYNQLENRYIQVIESSNTITYTQEKIKKACKNIGIPENKGFEFIEALSK